MATALSIVAGVLVALISILLSAQSTADLNILEIGGQIRALFNKYEHLFWLSWPDSSFELLQYYRYVYPDDDFGTQLWRIFYDVSKGASDDPLIDLAKLVVLDPSDGPQFGLMLIHLVELSIEELDPNSADRRFDVDIFNPDHVAARAYRSAIFPNGVLGFDNWFSIFVSFERMTSLLRHRQGSVIPEVLKQRSFTPDYIAQRINDGLELARGVSPLAYQAKAISRNKARISKSLRLARSRSLMAALIIASLCGVVIPLVVLLLPSPLALNSIVTWLLLFASAASLCWSGRGLAQIFKSPRVHPEVASMYERFSWSGISEAQEMIADINPPMRSADAEKLNLKTLASILKEYEKSTRDLFISGQHIKEYLLNAFKKSKLEVDFPIPENAATLDLGIQHLGSAESLGRQLAGYAAVGTNVCFRAGLYGRQLIALVRFRLPAAGPEQQEVVLRLSTVAHELHSSDVYHIWQAHMAAASSARKQLVARLAAERESSLKDRVD